MVYKGEENRNQQDYIFDTIPYIPEFDLEQLKQIESKLIDYTSGNSFEGLSPEEAEVFLDWITFNAREYAVGSKMKIDDKTNVGIELHSMTGQCAPTQRINVKLLKKLGLDAKAFNTGDCIKYVQGIEEDSVLGSKAVRHSVAVVNIPIVDNYGYTAEYKYLLDPTFRQFCLNENCNEEKFIDNNWLGKGHVAPHPGYFMKADKLQNIGISNEAAQHTQALGELIISKGYFYLNEENAKLYGDAFVRASKRLNAQNIPINMSGKEYINNFENIPMQLIGNDKYDEMYIKLPSEIEEKKQGLFSKIKDIFKKIFNKNDIKALPEGNINIPTKNPYQEFRKQYEFNGEVKEINKGQGQQLDVLVKNNDNSIGYEKEIE